MRTMLMVLLLVVIAAGPAIALDVTPRATTRAETRLLPWPPPLQAPVPGASLPDPGNLHFRGGKFSRGRGLFGRLTVDSASGPSLDMTRQEHRAMLELRGEWESAGLCTDSTYLGRFVYRDDATNPRLRGAQGAHSAVIDRDGTVHVHVTFDDRRLKPFDMVWMPWRPKQSIPVEELTPEQVNGMEARQMVHPVWPPPRKPTLGK